jgi:hypothetical protein
MGWVIMIWFPAGAESFLHHYGQTGSDTHHALMHINGRGYSWRLTGRSMKLITHLQLLLRLRVHWVLHPLHYVMPRLYLLLYIINICQILICYTIWHFFWIFLYHLRRWRDEFILMIRRDRNTEHILQIKTVQQLIRISCKCCSLAFLQ